MGITIKEALAIKKALTETQLANRWGMSVKTLQDWRRKGTGVAWMKLGNAVRYKIEAIEKYEADHTWGVL